MPRLAIGFQARMSKHLPTTSAGLGELVEEPLHCGPHLLDLRPRCFPRALRLRRRRGRGHGPGWVRAVVSLQTLGDVAESGAVHAHDPDVPVAAAIAAERNLRTVG